MFWLKNNPWKAVFIALFALFTAISLFTYRDYGISIDEPIQHQHLLISAKKVFSTLGILETVPQSIKTAKDLSTYEHRFYGVVAQYPLIILEFFPEIFAPNLPVFWFARHLYTRLIFVFAGVAFLAILKKITKSNLLAFIGISMFFFHPRIWAHSFYNIKDSIFLSFFVFSMYFLFRYFESHKFKDLILLGIISAITVNVRLMGLLIPAFFGLWIFLEGMFAKKFKRNFKTLIVFSASFFAILYLIWPVLWGSPHSTFTAAFGKFAKYDAWDGWILFAGNYISAKGPPKLYLPVWMGVTTPWGHLLTWAFGLILPILLLIKKECRSHVEKPYIFLSATFFVWASYLPVLILGSTLYSGWRHVQYVFAPLVLLGIYGLDLLNKRFSVKVKSVIFAFIFASLGYTAFWMVKNHPHEQVYFNALAGKNWNQNWEHDYWWLSSKQLLEFLVEEAKGSEGVLVFCAGNTGHIPLNMNLLPLDERKLLLLDCSKDYSYYLYNSNTLGEFRLEGFDSVYGVVVGGEVISSVYKKVE